MTFLAWRHVGLVALLLAAALVGTGGPASASESATLPAASAPDDGAANPSPPADPVGEAVGALASTRRAVRSATLWLARSIDSWFGDQPFDEGSAVSDGRLSLHLMTRQGEDPEARLRFNARMRLPNVERQTTYLLLGRDDPREIVKDRPEAVSPQQLLLRTTPADPSLFAALGLTLYDVIDFRLGFRGGLKPYAQARYRHAWALSDADLIEFRQTVFWSVDERLGSTTTLSYAHALSPTLQARWLSSATITQDSRVFEWSSVVGGYKSFGRQRQAALELILSGEQNSGVPVSDYGLQLRWEQPVHEDWLLVEIIVGHFRPRDTPQETRGSEWALGAGLKLRF